MAESAGGRSTVPQIFIGDTHVGGCDDLHDLEETGELDGLLADCHMIKYALVCAKGHEFESWFPDSAAFDKQRGAALSHAPTAARRGRKAIMAPAVVGGERPAVERGARP